LQTPLPSPLALAPRPAAEADGPRLLLVEDMESIGIIVQRLTKHAGHSLKWVTTAEDAWEYLQDHRPELVLLDIHLPRMNGIELCRKLRADPKQAGLAIALFSGGADLTDLNAGLEAGRTSSWPRSCCASRTPGDARSRRSWGS